MATRLNPAAYLRSSSDAAVPALRRRNFRIPFFLLSKRAPRRSEELLRNSAVRISRTRATNGGGDSYLGMWKKAVDRERKSVEFERIAEASAQGNENEGDREKELSGEDFEKKGSEFQKLLEVPLEERDRVQRMQVIDRAAAAIAAARALLKDKLPQTEDSGEVKVESGGDGMEHQQEGIEDGNSILPLPGAMGVGTPRPVATGVGTPGPSFWVWAPPANDNDILDESNIQPAKQASLSPAQSTPILEQDRRPNFLLLPFETSMLQDQTDLPLPPLQSVVEVDQMEVKSSAQEALHLEKEQEIGVQFSTNASEAADALSKIKEAASQGVNPDGSRWWMETGIEQRPDGVVCKWTLTRGVSADKAVEWENKYWEAADELGYKELGSEKSGRDAMGNVWHEYWRESMMQAQGLVHLEKTADKWGKNVQGDEWQEQWWEHYDAAGRAEKWADKWCSIDPHTPVDIGHAHVWHERWGEKYDGQGGSMKYTDKWAERFEGDGWAKWGDKWDEHFDPNSQGVKQGETWWEGKYGERWNRTWGEGHNGSGWVHKYGKSSSGEHWDTHIQQDTWYEKFPHYGFYHCFDNSVQLREVEKPLDWPELDPK